MIDLFKLVVILVLMVFLLYKKWNLGLVLLLNAVLVGLLFAYPVLDIGKSILGALVAVDTLQLAGAVYLVLLLAELMRYTKSMDGMVESLQILVRDSRLTTALMPLMIGLLPMIGGAMFSAPMVDEIGNRIDYHAERKTFVNYWYRHSMEFLFPLYPSLIMMATLLSTEAVTYEVYDIVSVFWPLTLVSLTVGALFGLRGIDKNKAIKPKSDEPIWPVVVKLLKSTWPLLLVIGAMSLTRFIPGLQVNMLVVLAISSVLVVLINRIPLKDFWEAIKRSFPLKTFAPIFGVMIFKHVLEDASAVERIPAALSSLGLPAMLVGYVIPQLVGLLTGTAAPTFALSVPLVLPLLTEAGFEPLTAGLWLFASGFSGVLLSPMHLCLSLTKEYYGAEWGGIYKRLVPSVFTILVAALVYVLVR